MWKDCETKIDLLDFDYLVYTLNSIIKNDKLTPSSIGVYGDWGSGKSSLLCMSNEILSKEPDFLCLTFNGWLFESYEDVKITLMASILDEIKNHRRWGKKLKDKLNSLYKKIDLFKIASKGLKYGLDFMLTGGIFTAFDLTKEALTGFLKQKGLSLTSEEIEEALHLSKAENIDLRKSIKEFYSEFSDLIEETKLKRLVVYIDELDRCNPSTILDVLEAIRLFLFVPKTSFVIGADERHISYAVKTKFKDIQGLQFSIGNEYLEKLIQYPIRIPRLDRRNLERYIFCLFAENELTLEENKLLIDKMIELRKKDFINYTIDKDVIQRFFSSKSDKLLDLLALANRLSLVLVVHYNGNPRQCKRFLNLLSIREQMASSREISLKREVMAKLMLLEVFKPKIFEELSVMQDPLLNYCPNIKYLEEDKLDQITGFKDCITDEWFIKWYRELPKLANDDLKPYFYFTKESVAFSFNVENRLSMLARSILSILDVGGEENLINAKKQMDSISEFEASIILDKLKDSMLIDKDIALNKLSSYLEVVKKFPSFHENSLVSLGNIEANRFNIGHLPILIMFGKEINKESEILRILNDKAKVNVELQKALSKLVGRK